MNLEQALKLKEHVNRVSWKVKNYDAMCEILGEEKKTGDSKKAQLKEWARWFDFDQEGHHYFLIGEIREIPYPKEDKRSLGNNNTYAKYVRDLVVLSMKENVTWNFIQNWLAEVGFINHLFLVRNTKQSLQKATTRYKRTKTMFEADVRRFGAEKFRDGLNYLIQNDIVIFREAYKILEDQKRSDKSAFRDATPEEESYIRKVRKKVLEEFGYKDMHEVSFNAKSADYFDRVNQIVNEEKTSWVSHYKVWEFTRGKNFDNHLATLNDVDVTEWRKQLNTAFVQFLKERVTGTKENRPKERIVKTKIGADRVERLPDYEEYFTIHEKQTHDLIDKYVKIKEKK